MSDNFESNQAKPSPESNETSHNTFTVENNSREAISQEMLDFLKDGKIGFRKIGIGHDISQIPDFPLRAVDAKMGVWITESYKDSSLETNFGLQKDTFLDTEKTEQLLAELNNKGFVTSIVVESSGARTIHAEAGIHRSRVDIGYPNAEAYRSALMESIYKNKDNKVVYDTLNEHLESIQNGTEKIPNTVKVSMFNSGSNSESPFPSQEEVINSLKVFEEVTSAVGTGLIKALSKNKDFDPVTLRLRKPEYDTLLRNSSSNPSDKEILEKLSKE